jgi:hypothetical protein
MDLLDSQDVVRGKILTSRDPIPNAGPLRVQLLRGDFMDSLEKVGEEACEGSAVLP